MNIKVVSALAGYASSIVLANLFITWFGLWSVFGLAFPAGTVFAGAALILRDAVHRYTGPTAAVAAIVAGAGLSLWLASPAVALASGAAFLLSELVDAGVFAKMRKRSMPAAVAWSGAVGAAIDTFVFLNLAGIPLTPENIGGQLAVKTALSGLAGATVWRVTRRSVRA